MNEKLRALFRTKEAMLKEMLAYAQSVKFEYTEDEVEKFGAYVQNLSVHMGVINKNQAEINGFSKEEIKADKEVCDIEERCKVLASKIYKTDKEVNDGMKAVFGDIKSKYVASKNQHRMYDLNSGLSYISETFASFDAKQ